MLIQQHVSNVERWGGVNLVIDRWLEQRHQLLLSFSALDDACDRDLTTFDRGLLDRFSEQLLDYLSLGHFTLYPILQQEAREHADGDALAAATQLLENLDPSTQMALAFESDFSDAHRCRENLAMLPAWLERIKRGMSERFTLENLLIARLHAVHAPTSEFVAGLSQRLGESFQH